MASANMPIIRHQKRATKHSPAKTAPANFITAGGLIALCTTNNRQLITDNCQRL
ncbi:MAG: hypothetical protein ACR2P4_09565 [Gammaproteobacteria bacterium]